MVIPASAGLSLASLFSATRTRQIHSQDILPYEKSSIKRYQFSIVQECTYQQLISVCTHNQRYILCTVISLYVQLTLKSVPNTFKVKNPISQNPELCSTFPVYSDTSSINICTKHTQKKREREDMNNEFWKCLKKHFFSITNVAILMPCKTLRI